MADVVDWKKELLTAEEFKSQGSLLQSKEHYDSLIKKFEQDNSACVPGQVRSEFLSILFNNRGNVKYLQVDFDDAIHDFTEALKFNSSMASSFYNRGLIHYRMGRFEEASKDMNSALVINNDFTDAQMCLKECQKELADKLNR